ncbi:hypothetical protein PH552_16180 [Rhizobium sp. CNPSo 3968]|uniref:hypothetical protein n=1 Tax=Rhizobium sp. CNPSo 3968 TaxID=3021408 RepID=UPI00254C9EC9|nr:hypothetical protein [Rhizobium sp. CNPSo 3968]MDK4720883.1 hypothetical protein [Rhizobium sp. CNPSo 3968]
MNMINRRQALGALASAAIVAPTAASAAHHDELDSAERVQVSAEALVEALRAMHGGSWSININHQLGFAAVSKDLA